MIEEADRETAAAIRVALYRAAPDMPSYAAGIIEPYLERHRQQAEDAMRERCAKAIEEWEDWGQWYGLDRNNAVASEVCRDAATAIRGIDAGGKGPIYVLDPTPNAG